MNYLEVFVLLQLLDFLTTLVGLRLGGGEGSFFISRLMRATDPLTGLFIAKCIGLVWAAFCLYRRKPFAIRLANYIFAGVVAWNLWLISHLAGLWT